MKQIKGSIVLISLGLPSSQVLVVISEYVIWKNFGEAKEGHLLLQDHGNEAPRPGKRPRLAEIAKSTLERRRSPASECRALSFSTGGKTNSAGAGKRKTRKGRLQISQSPNNRI